MKKTDPESFLRIFGRDYDELGYCIINGRHVRYIEERGVVQVGDDDFDRWANSVEMEFDVWQPKGMRQFERWALNR